MTQEEEQRLQHLESEAIFIFREAYRKFSKLALLWSMGKDSTTMLWLAKKAFLGRVPFPVVHVDTTFKFPEMVEFRKQLAQDWNFELDMSQNDEALAQGMNHSCGRMVCCTALKTEGLKKHLKAKDYRAVFAAIRRDEEGSRGKERFFSPRDAQSHWNYKEQPPEFWNFFHAHLDPQSHLRIHPLLNWTELDIWLYIQKENLPTLPLYFSKNGMRYRSVGCAPCTSPTESKASSIEEIIMELKTTQVSERSGRAQDHEDKYAMQKLRKDGYM
jgi:sulfate adenylyltransferase subunit 2